MTSRHCLMPSYKDYLKMKKVTLSTSPMLPYHGFLLDIKKSLAHIYLYSKCKGQFFLTLTPISKVLINEDFITLSFHHINFTVLTPFLHVPTYSNHVCNNPTLLHTSTFYYKHLTTPSFSSSSCIYHFLFVKQKLYKMYFLLPQHT